ncbi:MAG: hypothetical protein JSV56_08895 [Methanomassiliicoccales archaeon]|nr:MAG: hypothetical protein JSV56_08895 [Methanomassiliicoccales archaeon]
MKSKTLFIAAVVIASLFAIAMAPVEAALDAEDYNITKYDPMDDVMRVRTGGDFKFSPHNNVEIKEINSAYVEAVIPKIELTMKVEGTIKNHDDYKYAFTVIADINEYIFAAFQNGIGIGFQMGSDDLILGVTAEGENTDTLKNTFPLSEIGPPNNNYDVFGAAI